jgi:ribosomal protein L7Ae-like RNA K-turn-binding protein
LLVLAADAGAGARKTFQRLAGEAKIALVEIGTRDELGQAIGKSPRAILAVTSDQFVKGLRQRLTGVETKETSE